MMSHISKGDIHAYLDGALGAYPEEAARHVREHLDACGECAHLLEVEGRLRQEASAIIGASAQGPVELDPLEELLARASATGGPGLADGPPLSGGPGGTRRSLGSRMYSLRWAATIVVSLGAGWMARDFAGPAAAVRPGAVPQLVPAEEGLRSAADEPGSERDNIGGLAETETLGEPQAAVARELAEAIEPPESRGAGADGAPGAAGGGALRADQSSGRIDDDAPLDQVESVAARQRAESAATRDAAADASVGAPSAEPPVQAPAVANGLRGSVLDADRRAVATDFGDAVSDVSATASLSTTSFLVPGLPVVDVRLSPAADSFGAVTGGSVVVTQELGDGRVVELQFVPMAGSDAVTGGAVQERNVFRGRAQPAGWAMAIRDVPGGVAVLSGPLTEPELAELLERALGLR